MSLSRLGGGRRVSGAGGQCTGSLHWRVLRPALVVAHGQNSY